MTNTQSPAPGVAAEVDRLMALAWKYQSCAWQDREPHEQRLREALRTALQASAAAVPVAQDQLKRLSILNAFMVELDSRLRMGESHGDGKVSVKMVRDLLDNLFKAAPPLPAQVQEADLWKIAMDAFTETQDKTESIKDAWQRVVDKVLASRTPAPGMEVEPKTFVKRVGDGFVRQADGSYAKPEPKMAPREVTTAEHDFLNRALLRSSKVVSGAPGMAGGVMAEQWLPMETAPTDGTMVRLLVDYSGEDACHPLEDAASEVPRQTIGANNDSNVGDDEAQGWLFAGWSWEQDCFTQGHGKPIGWLPFATPHPSPAPQAAGAGNPTNLPESLGENVHEALVGALTVRGYRADGNDVALARRVHLMALEDRYLINMQKLLIETYRPDASTTTGRAGS